jgi:hypothetical protein
MTYQVAIMDGGWFPTPFRYAIGGLYVMVFVRRECDLVQP